MNPTFWDFSKLIQLDESEQGGSKRVELDNWKEKEYAIRDFFFFVFWLETHFLDLNIFACF